MDTDSRALCESRQIPVTAILAASEIVAHWRPPLAEDASVTPLGRAYLEAQKEARQGAS